MQSVDCILLTDYKSKWNNGIFSKHGLSEEVTRMKEHPGGILIALGGALLERINTLKEPIAKTGHHGI